MAIGTDTTPPGLGGPGQYTISSLSVTETEDKNISPVQNSVKLLSNSFVYVNYVQQGGGINYNLRNYFIQAFFALPTEKMILKNLDSTFGIAVDITSVHAESNNLEVRLGIAYTPLIMPPIIPPFNRNGPQGAIIPSRAVHISDIPLQGDIRLTLPELPNPFIYDGSEELIGPYIPSTAGDDPVAEQLQDYQDEVANYPATHFVKNVLSLTDTIPTNPMLYTGDDLIITMDLRTIVYKPSALNEILPREFKSY